MLRIADPAAAIVPDLSIDSGIMRQHGAAAVRVGLHQRPTWNATATPSAPP